MPSVDTSQRCGYHWLPNSRIALPGLFGNGLSLRSAGDITSVIGIKLATGYEAMDRNIPQEIDDYIDRDFGNNVPCSVGYEARRHGMDYLKKELARPMRINEAASSPLNTGYRTYVQSIITRLTRDYGWPQ